MMKMFRPYQNIAVAQEQETTQSATHEVSCDLDFTVYVPTLRYLGKDGVDHINIHPHHAQTALGKDLSMYAIFPFTHPVLGDFTCIEGYWFYLKTLGADEVFRQNSSPRQYRFKAKHMAQYRLEYFQEMVLDGFYYKLLAHRFLREAFLNSDLPIVQYWISEGKRMAPSGLSFINSGLKSLRDILRAGQVPTPVDYQKHFLDLQKK